MPPMSLSEALSCIFSRTRLPTPTSFALLHPQEAGNWVLVAWKHSASRLIRSAETSSQDTAERSTAFTLGSSHQSQGCGEALSLQLNAISLGSDLQRIGGGGGGGGGCYRSQTGAECRVRGAHGLDSAKHRRP